MIANQGGVGAVLYYFDAYMLAAHLLDCALKREADTGRFKLAKLSPTRRIDGAVALLDAMTVRQKHWDTFGWYLMNEGGSQA